MHTVHDTVYTAHDIIYKLHDIIYTGHDIIHMHSTHYIQWMLIFTEHDIV